MYMAFRYGQKYDIEFSWIEVENFIFEYEAWPVEVENFTFEVEVGSSEVDFFLFEVERLEFDFEIKSALPSRKEAEMLYLQSIPIPALLQ